jgi:anti-sigma-K factor RskA
VNERDHAMLDDVAVYALGALPPAEALRVKEHIDACELCRQEYAALKGSVAMVGVAAQTAGDARYCPSTLLKPRIMRQIKGEGQDAPPAAAPLRDAGPKVWPAYLVAAACLAIAVISSVANIALTGELRQARTDVTRAAERSTSLAATLADTRTTMNDLLSGDAKRYALDGGEIVTHGGRLYVAMRALPQPPRGKVYQAWTLAKGAKKVAPSLTFVPDARGVAVVAIPVDARTLSAVAISVEPDGGSKQPTTKPIAVVPLT